MIDHLKLFMLMSDILIGALVSGYILFAYRRYRIPSLKPLFFHVIFYNLLVLLLFTTKYYDVNIGAEALRIPEWLKSTTSNFLTYLFIIGFFTASMAIWADLLDKRISKRLFRILAVSSVLIFAGAFIEPLLPEASISLKIHYHFFENFGAVFVLLELGLIISLPFMAKRMRDKEKGRVASVFSYLYLSRYPAVALTLLLPQPFRLFFGLLYPNLMPLIWYQRYLLPWFRRSSAIAAGNMDLASITSRYGLSPRETEILGLILQGKNNREMEESLFISYHTVKNHVYNIYRKIGVKSRFELLHLLSGKNTSGS